MPAEVFNLVVHDQCLAQVSAKLVQILDEVSADLLDEVEVVGHVVEDAGALQGGGSALTRIQIISRFLITRLQIRRAELGAHELLALVKVVDVFLNLRDLLHAQRRQVVLMKNMINKL